VSVGVSEGGGVRGGVGHGGVSEVVRLTVRDGVKERERYLMGK
jgi:hypothetical protein